VEPVATVAGDLAVSDPPASIENCEIVPAVLRLTT
jgi:hypothetical protein